MADLKAFEAEKSLSVGTFGSACFCLRGVRLLVSPNGRLLRRVPAFLVVIVGSDRGRGTPELNPTFVPATIRLKAVACAAHTQTLLSTRLPSDRMFFSLLFRISRQDISPLLPPFHGPHLLTNREQLRGRLLVSWLCVIQNPFSTPRKRGRYRAMAHVLVRDWLRSRRRIHRMARQLVSPSSESISHAVPVIDHRSACERCPPPGHRPPCRIPLYYPAKMVFILYLVLPQTKGSSYLYTHHLQPFFHAHEPEIDATLSSLKTRSYAFIQEKFRGVWGNVATSMSQPAAANDLNEGLHDHAMNRSAPPSMHDPASGPANLMGSLLTTFGPNFLLQGMALVSSAQNAATTSTNEARKQNLETPGNSRLNIHDRRDSDEFVEEKSEAELQGYQVDSPPSGTGRFEEVDPPSDAEGDGQGYRRPAQRRSGSWFSWGSSNAGYERVKSD
jgi:receptor expression-enhancing protein 1/2/3/4